MIKAVLFDLYGTLIDIWTDEADPNLFDTLCRYLAYEQVFVDASSLAEEYHRSVREVLRASPEAHPDVDVHRIFRRLMERYGTRPCDDRAVTAVALLFRALSVKRFNLFPGVQEVLGRLARSYRLGLVSDAQWVFTLPELAMTHLDTFFPSPVLSSHFGFRKPDARLFFRALAIAGVPAGRAVYVGDNPERDLAGAKAAGMRSILFRRAGLEHGGLAADGCFDDYAELPGMLKKLR